MEFHLIRKKLQNKLSPSEKLEFDAWYEESENHRKYFAKVANNLPFENSSVDQNLAWERVKKRIENKKPAIKKWKLAMAALFILALGTNLFYNTVGVDQKETFQPKSEKIILITEEGKSIELSKDENYTGENFTGSGNQLIYTQKEHSQQKSGINILKVPRGEEFFVQLPDNTKIWLNSDSKIKYPTSFEINEPRRVEVIYGEVYFDVVSNKESNGANFFVKTGDQTIEVLGTEFNVRAYPEDEVIETSLAEGEISLSNNKNEHKNFLKPGMQSVYHQEKANWEVQEIDVENEVLWRKGVYRFEDEELETIMLALSRWFDKEVIFADKGVEILKFNGVFRKTQDLDNILEILQETNAIHFRSKDDKIIVEKNEKKENRN